MCAIYQITGNSLLLTMQLSSSTISMKQNSETKINMLGDTPSTEFVPDLHLLHSLRISHCETKLSDNYIHGKRLSLGTSNVSLSIL